MDKNNSRRLFLKQNSILGIGGLLSLGVPSIAQGINISSNSKPALLGGSAIRKSEWPKWPVWNPATDEELLLKVVRSGVWSRASVVKEFEEAWAKTVGSKRSLALVNGTNALITSLLQLDVGGGDEVIVPPYTFIANVAAILAVGAMPVFVDTNRETFQMDEDKIEAKVTSRTRAILPVHILGLPADMNKIMAVAKKHNLIVIEDACQAHLAELDNKQVGTFGDAGCFSFQNSKSLAMGEGGAIVSDNLEFMDRCYSYHNFGSAFGSIVAGRTGSIVLPGSKLRLTEYQAAIGLAQLKRLDSETTTRSNNAAYLRSLIGSIPGIIPYRLNNGVTRAVFHLFPFRYNKEEFNGLSREGFLTALRAEGVPCSSGYNPLNKMPYLENAFETKNYKKMYSSEELNYERFMDRNQCPENDRLCTEEAVWFSQSMLLGKQSDMNDIFNGIEKVYKNSKEIKKFIEKS
jgi:dTDP-4-amino-4,6-dideoxygalactose transaminase